MEATDTGSSLSLENVFSERQLSPEYKTEDNDEGKEHETLLEEPYSDDPDSDTEQPDSSSVSNGLCGEVTLHVHIALAIPSAEDDDSVTAVEKTKKKLTKKCIPSLVVEAPKAQGYYHIEYNLLPNDREPTKVDFVMFGLAAKLYKGTKSKVVKPWIEDDKIWLTWSQTVRIKVTKEMLIKLLHHKVTFRVWDTKDHISASAKHDRPKAFRVQPDKRGEEHSGTKNMIHRLRDTLGKEGLKTKPSKDVGEPVIAELKRMSDVNCATAEPKLSNIDVVANERTASFTGVTQEQQYTGPRSADQGGEQDFPLVDSRGPQDQDRDSKQLSQKASPAHANKKCHLRSNTIFKNSLANADYIRKNGAASAELSFIHLLAGEESLMGNLITHSKGVLEGMCSISLDQPLISGEMKTALNPLVITIRSAKCLPSVHLALDEEEENCLPVYCQYKFHNMEMHRTKSYEHSSNIYFKDVNVIFAGLVSRGELMEYLSGPPLEIEVHDRDKKDGRGPKSVFGLSPQDGLLSSVARLNCRGITHSPFGDVKPHRPHGIARLSFAELLNGHRSLRYNLPIYSSAPLQILGKDKAAWERKMLEVPGPRDDPQADVMPLGHYLESNSQLNIQVQIACPLNAENIPATEEDCPFGRIVHLMKRDDVGALTKLRAEILRVNTAAFQLKSKTEDAMQRALACYKVSTQEMESKELDFLTGFHLLDKNMHLFVIEGLKDQAIRRLWDVSSTKSDGIDREQITVLYNSALSFSKRLYNCLDLSFCPIHLHEPLEAIMRRPLVYVRDMVPHDCFQGLSSLNQLCQVLSMKVAVRNSLFPTAEMVRSLSKEFGSLPEKGQRVLEDICQAARGATQRQRGRVKSKPPTEDHNQQYVEWKQLVAAQQLCGETKDFVRANIEEVQRASVKDQKPKPGVVVLEVAEGKIAHNYSCQTRNTTEQAKELLRKELAKDPLQRFTYSQEFQLATFEPCDVDAERKAAEARSRRAWRTENGFTYHGFRCSYESNEHPKMPDEARIEELRKPWRENILHGNTLRPTLPQDTWPYRRCSEDFELYVKPPPVFLPKPPVTIHLAGDLLEQEQREVAYAQYDRWLRKILPDKHNPYSNRVPQFKLHMKKDGLDKLSPILKDQPMKYILAKHRKTVPVPEASGAADEERQRRAPRGPHGQESDDDQNRSNDPHHSSTQYKNNNSFRRYWRACSFQHKREALPLAEAELEVYRFQSRGGEVTKPPRPMAVQTPAAGKRPRDAQPRSHRAAVPHLH